MKFKIKHEKTNLVFMSSVIVLSLVTCIFWLMLREYIYFLIYLVLTLLIAFVYYYTYYFIKKDSLIIKLGFIKIKIKYSSIKKIENLNNCIRLTFKNFNMNIYPNNKDIFFAEINSKLKGN